MAKSSEGFDSDTKDALFGKTLEGRLLRAGIIPREFIENRRKGKV